MYIPPHFAQPDIASLHALMRAHPLATLVTLGPDGLDANHVPLQLSTEHGEHGLLSGHLPRANPAWREHAANRNVLAVFHGPEAYITPSWYTSKQATGKVVPTWNYVTVHAHGRLRAIDDGQWLRRHLEQLTRAQESRFPHPWAVADAPASYTGLLMRGLVGIEISITRLEGKWKVSQNRP
ncbi:MAG: FMN-binding negative transcriptional regulator, partial [Betaproteobacteria bacterium]|nr:FMN-binding negative transcriptional regulator [Betaproteobacteria bacterium]